MFFFELLSRAVSWWSRAECSKRTFSMYLVWGLKWIRLGWIQFLKYLVWGLVIGFIHKGEYTPQCGLVDHFDPLSVRPFAVSSVRPRRARLQLGRWRQRGKLILRRGGGCQRPVGERVDCLRPSQRGAAARGGGGSMGPAAVARCATTGRRLEGGGRAAGATRRPTCRGSRAMRRRAGGRRRDGHAAQATAWPAAARRLVAGGKWRRATVRRATKRGGSGRATVNSNKGAALRGGSRLASRERADACPRGRRMQVCENGHLNLDSCSLNQTKNLVGQKI